MQPKQVTGRHADRPQESIREFKELESCSPKLSERASERGFWRGTSEVMVKHPCYTLQHFSCKSLDLVCEKTTCDRACIHSITSASVMTATRISFRRSGAPGENMTLNSKSGTDRHRLTALVDSVSSVAYQGIELLGDSGWPVDNDLVHRGRSAESEENPPITGG